MKPIDNDVIIIGAGLAGLVAAAELTSRGHHVTILESEPRASLGGQAFWSFGGLFLVNSPEQRRLGVLRDAQVSSGLGKDPQVVATAQARTYLVDRLIRVSPPRPFTTPADGPLLAVRLSVLTRKTLGGLHTDTDARVLRPDGKPLPGLYAVGEAAGFGGGGVHGHRALEGTFLGGCLFSGRVAGRAIANAL